MTMSTLGDCCSAASVVETWKSMSCAYVAPLEPELLCGTLDCTTIRVGPAEKQSVCAIRHSPYPRTTTTMAPTVTTAGARGRALNRWMMNRAMRVLTATTQKEM